MKKITLFIIAAFNFLCVFAQEVPKLNDFGRIVLNIYVSDKAKITEEAKAQLQIKLKQIVSNYGMGGSEVNPRFIITADISITTKDIIAGPPQMVAQNMDVSLFIGDGIENIIYSNTLISTKGVGSNENKAFIDAIKQINTKDKNIQSFLEKGKEKIITYYITQCDFILQKAITLKEQRKYNEAIYELSLVPEVCKDCYVNCLNEISGIYVLKINADGENYLNEARAIWSSNPNNEGARQSTGLLSKINPKANCYSRAGELLKIINTKIISDEKDRLRRQEEYENRQTELDKLRINAYREIAVEYAKNQPPVVYRNIYWY